MTDMAEQLIALQRSDEMDALREANIALAAENAALKARLAEVCETTVPEADLIQEIENRDRMERGFSQAYEIAMGAPMVWSSAYDLSEAIHDMELRFNRLTDQRASIDTPEAMREVTVQEAWTVEDVTDHLEDVIGETHDIDVTDRNYAENVVQYLRRHPAALHALAGDDQ